MRILSAGGIALQCVLTRFEKEVMVRFWIRIEDKVVRFVFRFASTFFPFSYTVNSSLTDSIIRRCHTACRTATIRLKPK